MDITINKLLTNFNNYLKSSWQYLRFVDIEKETLDDNWDDWVELSYRVLVLRKIKDCFGKSIELGYGFWPTKESLDRLIEVKVLSNTKLLFALEGCNFMEEVIFDDNVKFTFVHFSHPFIEIDDSKSFEYVYGKVMSDNYFPKGTRVCAPLERCSFKLSSDIQDDK